MFWKDRRFSIAAFAISALFTFGLGWANAWQAWTIEPEDPLFFDIYAGLAAIDVLREGGNPVLYNPLDPLERPHIYGRIWLWLEPTGIGRSDTFGIGLLMGAGTLLTGAWVARPQTAGEAVWTTLLLVSPSVAFAIERANGDILVFLLLVAAGWALGPRAVAATGAMLAAFAMVMAATLYKFYSLASLAALMRGRSRGAAFSIAAAGSAILAGYFWWYREEIAFILTVMPSPLGYEARRAVGAPVVMNFLGIGSPWYRLIPMLAGAGFLLWVWLRPVKELAGEYSDRAVHYFLLGVMPWLACHWIASSFSYRGLLLIFGIPLCFELSRRAGTMAGRRRWALGLAPLWLLIAANPSHLAWAAEGLVDLVLTAAGHPVSSWHHYRLIHLFGLITQSFTWILSFGMAALLMEILRSSFRRWLGLGHRNASCPAG